MDTRFLLMAQYSGKVVIPADSVCKDYFPHLTSAKFIRKINDGNLALPLVRIEQSQKSAKGVHLLDLAKYLDTRREERIRAFKRMYGQI
jgi:hypothetical protein